MRIQCVITSGRGGEGSSCRGFSPSLHRRSGSHTERPHAHTSLHLTRTVSDNHQDDEALGSSYSFSSVQRTFPSSTYFLNSFSVSISHFILLAPSTWSWHGCAGQATSLSCKWKSRSLVLLQLFSSTFPLHAIFEPGMSQ